MTEATAVAIAALGVAGTLLAGLGGVWLGQRLESAREARSTKMRAYQEFVALILESATAVEAARVAASAGHGLAQQDDYRPEFRQEYFRAMSLIDLVSSQKMRVLGQAVQDRMGELIESVKADPAADPSAPQSALLAATGEFSRAAGIELGLRKA